MRYNRSLIPLLAGAVLVVCLAVANARSVAVEIEIHRVEGKELEKLKVKVAPIRQERTELSAKHYAETSKVTDAYRKKRVALEKKEDAAIYAFLSQRDADASGSFNIRLGVPFENRLRYEGKDLVFSGKSQPESSLYWPSADHVPKFIPCRYKISYGDRVLRSSWNPGNLSMGTWMHQLKRSGKERVYLVIRKRFVKATE